MKSGTNVMGQSAPATASERPLEDVGIVALTVGGFSAAFGLASCCALPILLSTAGVGTAWLTEIAVASIPHRSALLLIGFLCLASGAVLLFRRRKAACTPGSICSSTPVRALTVVGLLAGFVLLYLGYVYV